MLAAMTRIIIQWLLIFIIGGIVLLVSGETAMPTPSNYKPPTPFTPLLLSTSGDSSSKTSSHSVDPKIENTHFESENLASTISVFDLGEASNTSEPLEVSKANNSVFSEVVSTEALTEILSTNPSNDETTIKISKNSTGGYDGMQRVASNSDDQESEPGMDLLDVEENIKFNASDSPSNEIPENSKNILSTGIVTRFDNDASSTASSVQNELETVESSKSQSSVTKITSDKGLDASATDGNTSVKTPVEWTTEAGNTVEHSVKHSSTRRSITPSSGEDSTKSTFAVSQSTKFSATETLETADADKMASEDLSTENSLSLLHKTTPKSATKKRSLNDTVDSIAFSETTAASNTFSSTSLQPEFITLLEQGGSSTPESVDGMIMVTNSNTEKVITMKEGAEQNANVSSLPTSAIPKTELENSENGREKNVMHEEVSSEAYSTSSSKYYNFDDNKNTEAKMATENLTFSSEASASTKVTGDNSNFNKVDHVGDTVLGVTFDPDGMKNGDPQDPDSVVFYVPSTISDKAPTPQNTYSSTVFTGSESSESEKEFEFATHKNLKEGDGNGAAELERMEFMPEEKNTNTSPEPSRDPMDSHEVVTFHTGNDSDSSSSLVFWDPSNGGWILPETVTDPQIKRMDLVVNDESEEMLQDAPQFSDMNHTQDKPFFTNLKLGPKEKDSMKSTVGEGSFNLGKDTEVETVTELGFVGFSNSFVPHHTDQSVIRPVKIKPTSPEDKSVFTSILPESISTPAPQQPTVLKVSEPTAGSATEKIESSSTNSSSPIILPNPVLSVTETVKNPELSTIVIQPELVPTSLDKITPNATETANVTSVANSTIAGIAVKTSVSVSLPLSKVKNGSQPMTDDLMKHTNDSSLLVNSSASEILKSSDLNAPTSDSSTDGLTITSPSDQTTAATGFKIRKPKIKITGGTDSGLFTPRPARPFSPSLKRPTTTAGPLVSVFKKQRTRIASITSSTTGRPLRNFNVNFATVKIQYASDIPGLLPQEFLISTEPITTTTPEPTTTEEPISEVPFTDPTHVPTVVSEDDVTLVKVAGYIVLDRGLRWNDLLHNRHSPEYKKNAEAMHLYLERMFRSSPIASRLWKIQIDGFSGNKKTRPVGIDFFLYLIKNGENVATHHLATVFHEKLSVNNTFGTFRVDPSKTAFEMIQEEPLKAPTPSPEEENVEPPIPQWAIAVIVIGAASLIFIVLFAAVTIYGRHHMRRRYSSKLSEEDMERSSGEWESKMAAAYENMAADTIYDAEDLQSDSYKKSSRIATFHGIPSTLKRCDSWSSNGWTTPPKKQRPHVH